MALNLPPDVLEALKASLATEAHEWALIGQMEHEHTEQQGLETVVKLSQTYQLQSLPLQLLLPITVELEDGELDVIRVFYQGTSFDTTDEELHTMIGEMAGPAAEAAAAEFLAMLQPEA